MTPNLNTQTGEDTPLSESHATAQHPAVGAQQTEETPSAWTLCEPLARSENILDLFAEQLHRNGFAGDTSVAQLVYLSMTSRLLDEPVSLVLKGSTGGGKSRHLKTVMDYFPASAYHKLSSMSPKALTYMDEPLAHRMLIVAEQDGVQDKKVDYLLRTLLSEGCIEYMAPVNKDGKWVTERFTVEGPTGLLITTTLPRLHAENETRLFSLDITESPEHSRAILQAQAQAAQNGKGQDAYDYTVWHALQRWLETNNGGIVIPFANGLSVRIPALHTTRLHRDFPRMLQLICVHALLHQVNRERDALGRIVATLDDYAVVYELVAEVISVGIGATVSEEMRETVAAVGYLSERGGDVSITALAQELGLAKSSVSRRVESTLPLGYLRNLETRRGRPARLRLGDALPETCSILPHPTELQMDA